MILTIKQNLTLAVDSCIYIHPLGRACRVTETAARKHRSAQTFPVQCARGEKENGRKADFFSSKHSQDDAGISWFYCAKLCTTNSKISTLALSQRVDMGASVEVFPLMETPWRKHCFHCVQFCKHWISSVILSWLQPLNWVFCSQ